MQGHPADQQQKLLLQTLKEDWMESLAILKQANKGLKLAKSTHTNHKELKNMFKDLTMFHNE